MFTRPNLPSPSSLVPKFLTPGNASAVGIRPVKVHEIETAQEKRARSLKHLLKLNHVNNAILYNDLKFHNHAPHILSSAYLMGADTEQLDRIYEEESQYLTPWHDSPSEITTDDWRDFWGKREYQRAFVDFFEDEIVHHGYDWKAVVHKMLFSGKEPLVNCLIAGLGHPLIHLGYAFEMSSCDIAVEALALATTSYNYLHKYLDDPSYSERASPYHTSSPLEILDRIREDERFDDVAERTGGDRDILFRDYEDAILEHWNAWDIADPVKQFEQSHEAATAILTATGGNPFNFLFVHILTTSHAIRILLPFIPAKYHVSLIRQWWLLVVPIYIAQGRPKANLDEIRDYDRQGRDWEWAEGKAVKGKWSTDAHYVKPIRGLKEFANTWGDADEYYLKAAVKFADDFDEWAPPGVAEKPAKVVR